MNTRSTTAGDRPRPPPGCCASRAIFAKPRLSRRAAAREVEAEMEADDAGPPSRRAPNAQKDRKTDARSASAELFWVASIVCLRHETRTLKAMTRK